MVVTTTENCEVSRVCGVDGRKSALHDTDQAAAVSGTCTRGSTDVGG